MSGQEKSNSDNLRIVVIVLGSLIVGLVIFAAGVSVGIRKARFSYKFGENYEKNFVGPEKGALSGPKFFMRKFEGRDFRNAHGIVGEIISITEGSIVIKDADDKENTVTVNEDTAIRRRRDSIKITDLKNNDRVAVMGRPDDNGTVRADLIRVFEK